MKKFLVLVSLVFCFALVGCEDKKEVVVIQAPVQQTVQLSQDMYMHQQLQQGYIDRREYNDFMLLWTAGTIMSMDGWFSYKSSHQRPYYRTYKPYKSYAKYKTRSSKKLKKKNRKLASENAKLKKQLAKQPKKSQPKYDLSKPKKTKPKANLSKSKKRAPKYNLTKPKRKPKYNLSKPKKKRRPAKRRRTRSKRRK